MENGAFSFTSDGNNRAVTADKLGFMPRVGLAWHVNKKTAIRAGYGRFIVPTSLIMPDRDANGELPLGAFSPTTNALPMLSGIPQAYFANPYPQGLTAVSGKQYGRYTQLGDPIAIDKNRQKPPVSDRSPGDSLSLEPMRTVPRVRELTGTSRMSMTAS